MSRIIEQLIFPRTSLAHDPKLAEMHIRTHQLVQSTLYTSGAGQVYAALMYYSRLNEITQAAWTPEFFSLLGERDYRMVQECPISDMEHMYINLLPELFRAVQLCEELRRDAPSIIVDTLTLIYNASPQDMIEERPILALDYSEVTVYRYELITLINELENSQPRRGISSTEDRLGYGRSDRSAEDMRDGGRGGSRRNQSLRDHTPKEVAYLIAKRYTKDDLDEMLDELGRLDRDLLSGIYQPIGQRA